MNMRRHNPSKIDIFAIDGAKAGRLGKGVIDFRAEPLLLGLNRGSQTFDMPLKAEVMKDLHGVIDETFAHLGDHFDMAATRAAGHRVVHGGNCFTAQSPSTMPSMIPRPAIA